METKDRRIERTRSALLRAFNDLVLTKGYAALTVDSVARRADVGRSTFYMHYRSLEDLLLRSLERPSAPLAALVRGDAAAEMLVPQLEHFREQRRLNRVFLDTPVRDIWVKCLARLIERELAPRRLKTSLPLPMIAAHIAQSQIALVAAWILSWQQTKVQRVAEALVATTNANMTALAVARV
jgi:AcrR family transcriptional regulator